MLQTLTIRQFAIIEDLEVDFRHGMNIMLGETGAGKSIMIEALSLLLGERSSFDKIRHGATKATIEGLFVISNPSLLSTINQEYPDIIEGDQLVVSRTLEVSGRTTIRMNGQVFSQSGAKKIMEEIIDIHSQHQNLTLLDERNHLLFLDKFAQNDNLYACYHERFRDYLVKKERLQELQNMIISADEIDYLTFQIREIEDANIEQGEMARLEQEQRRLQSFERIAQGISNVTNLFDDENGLIMKLFLAKKELESLHDPLFEIYAERTNSLYYEAKDVLEGLSDDFSGLANSAETLSQISDRLYSLHRLQKKYIHLGSGEDGIFTFLKESKEKLYNAENHQKVIIEQENIVYKAYQDALKVAHELSKNRLEKALLLSSNVDKELHELSLEHAHFEVSFAVSDLTEHGIDKVAFLLSANKGTPLSPLKNVVSGGEASRLMLGLKAIFLSLSSVETIIFDEVDTGVSGRVAMQVASKIYKISKKTQVIAITHLPQVAAIGDNFYYVSKYIENNVTKSRVELLQEDAIVGEISKMLSGESSGQGSRLAAQELIKEAQSLKNKV